MYEVRLRLLGLVVVALLTASSAQAAVIIDFEQAFSAFRRAGTTYIEDGFAVTFGGSDPDGFYIGDGTECSPDCASDGTNTLMAYRETFEGFTLDRLDGGAFSLISFDGGEGFSGMQYQRYSANAIGVGALAFELDSQNDGPGGAADFQTFLTPTFASVTSVWFRGLDYAGDGGAIFRVDNLVVDEAMAIQPVPEPASVMLVGTGLAGALIKARRRRRQHIP